MSDFHSRLEPLPDSWDTLILLRDSFYHPFPTLKEKKMKILRKLSVSITLVLLIAMVAFAGETSSPPCVPGETSSPPCSSPMAAGNVEDSDTNADVASSITEVAQLVVESVLPLF